MKLDDVKLKRNEIMFVHGPHAVVRDTEYHLKRIFRKKNGAWTELDLQALVEKSVEYLKDKVSMSDLIRDFLLAKFPGVSIPELAERVENSAKVRGRPGCFSALVFGKKGEKALPLWFVDP